MVRMYWLIGNQIVERSEWGNKFVDTPSRDISPSHRQATWPPFWRKEHGSDMDRASLPPANFDLRYT